jgi:hopanoid C-2 methylase
MWRSCMAAAYHPKALFARYEHQMRATWPNRLKRPMSRQRLSPSNIAKGLAILARIIWIIGIRGDYRRNFWTFALRRFLRGEIEPVLSVSLCAHHLIMFARDACEGRVNASHFSAKTRALNFEAARRV